MLVLKLSSFFFGCFCLRSRHWNLPSENFTFLTQASTLGSLAAVVTDIATHCSADRPMGRPKRILHRYTSLRSTGLQPYRLGKSSLTAPILATASKRRARREQELWDQRFKGSKVQRLSLHWPRGYGKHTNNTQITTKESSTKQHR